MPELPEVETSRRGIAPHILGKTFQQIDIRQPQLRWPVPVAILNQALPGQHLLEVDRRGKYLLLKTAIGTILLHLGMSGNLRITSAAENPNKHDHIDFIFSDGTFLRLNDQRRFGAVLWTVTQPEKHPLLSSLGPEPLSEQFNADYLLSRSRQRRLPVKSLIMDSHVVVGVGNIYASESLFLAGLHPNKSSGDLTLFDCDRLVSAIQRILQWAIEQGGTTLRDFLNHQGKPGYFQQSLSVYGRKDQPCINCAKPIQQLKIGQRASYFCQHCQPL